MAKATQKGRILSIQTSLGEDYLLLNKVNATEKISELYQLEVEIIHDSEKQINTPHIPELNSVLGQAATISLNQRDGGSRYFNGIFKSLKLTGRTDSYSFYQASLVPQVWELTQVSQSRIFQQKSVKDILLEVFSGYQIKMELQWNYKPRNYCVQYNETDFDFASRLMEEEGICYYFEFSNTAETMIITDNFQQPRDCPNKSDLPIYDEQLAEDVLEETALRSWFVEYKIQCGKVTLWDYHFQLPKKKLETQQISRHNIGGNQQLEIYKYPGGFARKYDGISKDGGEQSGDLQNIFEDNQQMSKDQMEIFDSDFTSYYGDSDCGTMIPGFRFNLKNHPNGEYNAPYILTSVTHEINQQPNFLVEMEYDEAYKNSFTCIPHGSGKPEFRPYTKTARPMIYGSQTAIVVGPSGEEIFTDKYGRVKVQFHWDRKGQNNSDSSCWVRVAQTVAGNKWGAMFIPRIGMEVIVHFLEGDPDQPIITGCVYNPDTMPPYTLPDEKTKSTLKTNSTVGGGGFNEFRIEDKKGSEQIFVHGEKNLDIRIKNDAKEIIKRDRHLIVERNQFEKVNGDKHLKVTGNQNEQIDGAFGLKVGTNIQEKAGQKFAVDAGTEIHLKAGMTATIEAGTMLTLKVGGNSISINSGGVFISGTMVNINSASVSGSGSGCSPTPPDAPLEADTANPGDRIALPTPPPPLSPRTRSQKSAAMKKAAEEGTPFVAVDSSADEKKKKLDESLVQLKKEALKVIKKLLEKAKKDASDQKEKSKKDVKDLKKKVEEAISEIKEKQKEAEEKLNQGAKKVKQAVNEGINKLKKASEQGKDILKKAESEAKEKLKKIGEGVEQAEEKAKKTAQEGLQKAQELKEKAQEKITETKQELENKAEEAKKAVEEKIESAKQEFAEKKEEIAKELDEMKKKFSPF